MITLIEAKAAKLDPDREENHYNSLHVLSEFLTLSSNIYTNQANVKFVLRQQKSQEFSYELNNNYYYYNLGRVMRKGPG